MKVCGCLLGVIFFGFFPVGVGGGQQPEKNNAGSSCGGHPSAVVNGALVPCVNVEVPPTESEADSWYAEELDKQRTEMWVINQGSIAGAKILTEKNSYNPKELARVVRKMKKTVDDLCRSVQCDKKIKDD